MKLKHAALGVTLDHLRSQAESVAKLSADRLCEVLEGYELDAAIRRLYLHEIASHEAALRATFLAWIISEHDEDCPFTRDQINDLAKARWVVGDSAADISSRLRRWTVVK